LTANELMLSDSYTKCTDIGLDINVEKK